MNRIISGKLLATILIISSGFCFGQKYNLNDYLSNRSDLDLAVDSVLQSLDDHSRVAQLLMPAIGRLGEPTDSVRSYVRDGLIGGVLMLNGTKDQFSQWVREFNSMNENAGRLPFLYSADAEPSLVNSKIKNSNPVPKAMEHSNEEQVKSTALSISKDLNDIGINYNFSPVVDMSTNRTVGYRGFGSKPENIIPFSQAFIETTQASNILATAKHFPGHGLVTGDTHSALQVINGEMKELDTYPPLIDAGVLSIMIAHIAVKNNVNYSTNGLPSTCSKSIVTDLLRDSLGFKGLVVTDAMNMGGISRVSNADILCTQAGCDILLMPLNIRRVHRNLLSMYRKDIDFQLTVDSAVRRIIRAKICLGLIP